MKAEVLKNFSLLKIKVNELNETKSHPQYLIGHLDKVLRKLLLVLPKMSECVKTFKVKDGDK